MNERMKLIADLDQARATMAPILERANEQSKIYDAWTIKEIVAHLAGWDDAVIASLRAHKEGNVPDTPAVRGIDLYNAQSVAERQALNYEQILREYHQARQILKDLLRDLSDEKYAQKLVSPWGQECTVSQLIEVFVDHEQEHAEEITQLLDKQASHGA